MIDYEWQIRMLEKDLAHAKEMQALARVRMDAHDTSIGAIEGYLGRIAAAQAATDEKLAQLAAGHAQLAAGQAELQAIVKTFIDSLRRGGNGHS